MPALIFCMILSFVNGFLCGMAAALAILQLHPEAVASRLLVDSPLGMALTLFAAGSCFGLGSVATALSSGCDAPD